MMKLATAFAALACAASAFRPTATVSTRRGPATTTQLQESFLGIGTDTYSSQPDPLKGEAEYKQWINTIDQNNMLNRKYNVVGRVRELNLLKTTADAGVLSKLEKQGLDLVALEKLLPVAEDLGLLSLVGSNQQMLVNLAAPLLIEPAPFLIPLVAGAIEIGPAAFFALAAACGGLELYFITNNVEVPLVGLSAALVGGLLLVPLTVVGAAAGVALGNLKKA